MTLEVLLGLASEQGASDLHLEGGLPAALRVRGALKMVGEPISPEDLKGMARDLVGEGWNELVERRSYDLSRTIRGVRCRVNVLHSARGVGMAIRLLSSFQATLRKLNLHPDLKKLISHSHGLILMSGPTGSGKTSTLTALIQEINVSEARHIVTLESPIEYPLTPKLSFIRQREVGRDTPSFEQGLIDALREDPDVLMVGEMRDPQTLRLTLTAAETGHLVISTVHSSSCAEALQRVVSAFAPEVQPSVCAQLADCLVGVVCQRLRYREDLGIRVPECEVMMGSTSVKSVIRRGELFKLPSAMESGGADGNWSYARYAAWLEKKTDWYLPSDAEREPLPAEPLLASVPSVPNAPTRTTSRAPRRVEVTPTAVDDPGVFVIGSSEDDPEQVLRELQQRKDED